MYGVSQDIRQAASKAVMEWRSHGRTEPLYSEWGMPLCGRMIRALNSYAN